VDSDSPGAVFSAKPVREVYQDAGREAGFGDAEKKARPVKLPGRVNERRQGGNQSPGDHDACDPAARAPALRNERPGNLQQDVSEEKHARAKTKHAVAEVEI